MASGHFCVRLHLFDKSFENQVIEIPDFVV